jgi:hypothetical protein
MKKKLRLLSVILLYSMLIGLTQGGTTVEAVMPDQIVLPANNKKAHNPK